MSLGLDLKNYLSGFNYNKKTVAQCNSQKRESRALLDFTFKKRDIYVAIKIDSNVL